MLLLVSLFYFSGLSWRKQVKKNSSGHTLLSLVSGIAAASVHIISLLFKPLSRGMHSILYHSELKSFHNVRYKSCHSFCSFSQFCVIVSFLCIWKHLRPFQEDAWGHFERVVAVARKNCVLQVAWWATPTTTHPQSSDHHAAPHPSTSYQRQGRLSKISLFQCSNRWRGVYLAVLTSSWRSLCRLTFAMPLFERTHHSQSSR